MGHGMPTDGPPMAEIFLVVTPVGFEPCNPPDAHWHGKKQTGTIIRVEAKQPRDHKRLREAFGLLNLVFPHQDKYRDFEGLREFVTKETGFVDIFGLQGTPYYIERAKSWAFHNMEDPEFNRLLDGMKDVILEHFWPDMTKAELNQHYAEHLLNWCGAGGLSEIDRMSNE